MRPKGHILDTSRPSGTVHHTVLTGITEAPQETYLEVPNMDVQVGQSCTGSDAKLIPIWCKARGIPCAEPSRLFSYSLGRSLASGPGVPLQDIGAQPAFVVAGMRDVGVVAEANYPSYDIARINDSLEGNVDAFQRAGYFKVKDIAVIEEEGDARCLAIRRALGAQIPVGLAIDVDAPFENWTIDAVYDGPTRAILGRHRVRVVGCALGKFLIANSWPDWGIGVPGVAAYGLAWISARLVGSTNAYDPYALNFAAAVEIVP